MSINNFLIGPDAKEFVVEENDAICKIHCISIDNIEEVKKMALNKLKSLGVRDGVALTMTEYDDYTLLSFTGVRELVESDDIYIE